MRKTENMQPETRRISYIDGHLPPEKLYGILLKLWPENIAKRKFMELTGTEAPKVKANDRSQSVRPIPASRSEVKMVKAKKQWGQRK